MAYAGETMKLKHIIWLVALVVAALGCGGGGGAGPFVAGGPMFMTDSLDNHAHVWITIKQVVFSSASGNVTAYSDPVGTTIDLKTLRDNSGRKFAYLTAVPSGTYTGVTVTVDKTVTMFDLGNSTPIVRVFAGNNGSTADLTMAFSPAKPLGPGIKFALDFDLANWNDDGTTITGNPFLGDASSDSGIDDPSRHEHEQYEGVVQALAGTAPTQSFNLVRGEHMVAVVTTAQTVIYNSDGSPNPNLVNGGHVHVRGAFDTTQNAIVAVSIKIQLGNDDHESPVVEGTASNIDTSAFTFVVTIAEAEDFTPSSTTVNIATNSSTVFAAHCGSTMTQADFFAALANGSQVEVAGTYDSASNTITAARVRLEDGGDGGDHNSQVQGPSSNIVAAAGTLDITVHEWEGANLSSGATVHVVTGPSTVFNEGAMNQAQWFAALVSGQSVEAEGTFDASTSTLTATSIKTDH